MNSIFKYLIILICIFVAGCKQKTAETKGIKTIELSPDTVKSNQPIIESENKVEVEISGDFTRLLPIAVLNADSKNVYEKYGIEFSGNCYACDLAAIRINKKHFDIINVCDKDDFYRNEKFTYEVQPNGIKITTATNEFIFTKIDAALVYELTILGDKISLKNKRFSKFYTPEKGMKKFKQHDCGAFDG